MKEMDKIFLISFTKNSLILHYTKRQRVHTKDSFVESDVRDLKMYKWVDLTAYQSRWQDGSSYSLLSSKYSIILILIYTGYQSQNHTASTGACIYA